MGFIIILAITAFALAGSAAYFSIYGLAQIFSGAFWPVVIMASTLEIGKLVTASYVYRFSKHLALTTKAYLITAIAVLMIITSAGIFGFLSSAYQKDMLPMKQVQQQIVLLEQENVELDELKQERLERKKQIDNDIASLPNNYVTARQRLLESFGPELEQLKVDVADYTKQMRVNSRELQELRGTTLEQEAHVGPIIFIASVFDAEVDDATKWLILMIIFAFDPLAVALTVATNKAMMMKSGRHEEDYYEEAYVEPHPAGVDADMENVNEPNPSIDSLDQLLDNPVETLTLEQLKEALAQFQVPEHELSEEEKELREMLTLQLARKDVKDKMRRG